MGIEQFYQQMQLEQEMHFITSVNDVSSAFEYHGVEAVLDELFKHHPSFKQEALQYLSKQTVLT